jgi:hypothetical protein
MRAVHEYEEEASEFFSALCLCVTLRKWNSTLSAVLAKAN